MTLIEELREDARGGMVYHELSDRAAAEIERLRAKLKEHGIEDMPTLPEDETA